MLVSGVPAFLMMPVLPCLLGKVDFRVLVVAGLLLLRVELPARHRAHRAERRTTISVGSQLLRGVGQMLAMMPLNQAAMAAVSRE